MVEVWYLMGNKSDVQALVLNKMSECGDVLAFVVNKMSKNREEAERG